jgi:hypothetical protein
MVFCIVGNHRDAWVSFYIEQQMSRMNLSNSIKQQVFGAVDPSSGSSAMVSLHQQSISIEHVCSTCTNFVS